MTVERGFQLIFIGSLAATASQLVLIKTLEGFIHHEVFCYALILGAYFWALAGSSRRHTKQSFSRIQAKQAVLVPCSLALLLWTPALLNTQSLLGDAGSPYVPDEKLAVVIPLAMLISYFLGRWHGYELPIVLREINPPFGTALTWSYLGALVGYTVIPLYLLPRFGVMTIVTMLGPLYWLNFWLSHQRLVRHLIVLVGLGLSCGIGYLLVFGDEARRSLTYADGLDSWPETSFTSLLEAAKYANSRIHVQHKESAIQSIDWVDYHEDSGVYSRLYLNSEFQFDERTEAAYHNGFFENLPQPDQARLEQVLVLGGGDGLLARDLLTRGSRIKKIDLVEIDPEMIRLASHQPRLKRMNRDALKDSRLEIHYADAYFYVQKCREQYDAILIDLPYPSSFALSRLYSREFYSATHACLKDQGVLILDAPTANRAGEIIRSTLASAGFSTIVLYGKGNSYAFGRRDDALAGMAQSQATGSFINHLWRPLFPLLD